MRPLDKVYISIRYKGEFIKGYVRTQDIEVALRHNSSISSIDIHGSFTVKFRWDIIKHNKGIQNYIKNYLPEYTI